jgi:hypothetical protein
MSESAGHLAGRELLAAAAEGATPIGAAHRRVAHSTDDHTVSRNTSPGANEDDVARSQLAQQDAVRFAVRVDDVGSSGSNSASAARAPRA